MSASLCLIFILLALGEGTGAVMMFSLLDIAMSLYETGATFGDFKIEEYHRF